MNNQNGSIRIQIIAAYVILCVIWSSTWLVIKIGLQDLPPISFVVVRFLIAIVFLVIASVGCKNLLPKNKSDLFILMITGLLMFGLNYPLVFWAEGYVSSALAAVLQATIPVFGMVFAYKFLPNVILNWRKFGGALIALFGVAVICGRLLDKGGVMALWGGIGLVIGAMSAAFANVLMKRQSIKLPSTVIAAWQMIFGIFPLIGIALVTDGNPMLLHWNLRAWICLLYLGIIGSALAFFLLYWLLHKIELTSLQSITLITPPGAVLIGWAAGGESFSVWSLVGAAFVLLGVWMIFRKSQNETKNNKFYN